MKLKVDGKTIELDRGKNLLEVLRANSVDIECPCNGKGTCGKCKVKLDENFIISETERKNLQKKNYPKG